MGEEEEVKIKGFIEPFVVEGLRDEIVSRTIKVRKQYRFKLPDAIIAATALVNEATLVTHNKKDFEKVEGLGVVDPLEG